MVLIGDHPLLVIRLFGPYVLESQCPGVPLNGESNMLFWHLLCCVEPAVRDEKMTQAQWRVSNGLRPVCECRRGIATGRRGARFWYAGRSHVSRTVRVGRRHRELRA